MIRACALFRKSISLGVLAAALLAAAGCGGPIAKPAGVAIRGKVLLPNGAPCAGGVLVLRPVDGIFGVSGMVQPDGGFVLTDSQGAESVAPGGYQVYLTLKDPKHQALRHVVPAKYQDSENGDSDLIVDIQEKKSDLVIQLKR